MILDLESIFARDGASRSFSYEFSLEDEVIASPVHVEGRVFQKTGVVYLDAEASYALDTVCAKCSSPVRRNVEVKVEHILVTHVEDEDDDDYIVVDDMRLDLDELVGEDIFLAMPSRYLCREDCKGLCSICGADLNLGDCGCNKPKDPRWDALKDYFDPRT